uniref:RNA polymerase II elongation factor ELL N-terminal domain-containing protein n=1 Tax=Anopheles culicifacies TaxID=139723 RepID=A0A182MT73_9DIPT
MAALCAGSYGLSQQGSLNDENKELIFVKLTDSALRAIEEFQRTQVSHGSHCRSNPYPTSLRHGSHRKGPSICCTVCVRVCDASSPMSQQRSHVVASEPFVIAV